MPSAREFDGYNIQPQVYGTYAAEQYGKDRDEPPQPDVYKPNEVPPGGPRYSKFDYDPLDEDREPRPAYRERVMFDEGPREGEPRYPRPLTRPPLEPEEGGYSRPPPRDYPPYRGGRLREEEEWRHRPLSPPPCAPPRDYPRGHPPYTDPEPPIPPPVHSRPLPSHLPEYRGPPPDQEDPYYHRPPPEPRRNPGILSQMESIDYSHGGGTGLGVKSVDYHHGTPASGGYPLGPRDMGTHFPYGDGGGGGGGGGGYASAYEEGAGPGSYMYGGAPAGGGYGSGLDPAAIFAAYQEGIYGVRVNASLKNVMHFKV